MNKKTIAFGLAVATGLTSLGITNAFWGGDMGMKNFNHPQMTQERFEEMKSFINQYSNVEDFLTAKEAQREARRSEMEKFRENMNRNVENIDNGVVMTITSDDADTVAHIKERENEMSKGKNHPNNDKVSRIIESITNGVKITITSEDADFVQKIQNREKNFGQKGEFEKGSKDFRRGNKGRRADHHGRGSHFSQDTVEEQTAE